MPRSKNPIVDRIPAGAAGVFLSPAIAPGFT
jgi:hypothetical protein